MRNTALTAPPVTGPTNRRHKATVFTAITTSPGGGLCILPAIFRLPTVIFRVVPAIFPADTVILAASTIIRRPWFSVRLVIHLTTAPGRNTLTRFSHGDTE